MTRRSYTWFLSVLTLRRARFVFSAFCVPLISPSTRSLGFHRHAAGRKSLVGTPTSAGKKDKWRNNELIAPSAGRIVFKIGFAGRRWFGRGGLEAGSAPGGKHRRLYSQIDIRTRLNHRPGHHCIRSEAPVCSERRHWARRDLYSVSTNCGSQPFAC